METLGCSSIEQYLDVLDENRTERETLLFFLRITISRFFRDRELWTSLADSGVQVVAVEKKSTVSISCIRSTGPLVPR